jgi:uncharacterized protein
VASVSAFAAGIVDVRGLLAIGVLASACVWARQETRRPWAIVAVTVVLAVCAALFLHVVPGFDNPRVVDAEVLGPGSLPYTKYLNVDKGIAGLLLIGIYLRGRTWGPRLGGPPWRTALGIFVTMTAVVMLLSVAFGYVRWDPKLPSWTPLWMWSMVFLTALPEEALFRGVVQNAFERWMGARRHATAIAVIAAGVLFGAAHAAGGPLYVVLASVAGIGYGWTYVTTRSIAWAIAAHAGLNTVHLLFFSYPALIRP